MRRRILLICCMATGLTALHGCGGDSSETAKAEKPAKVEKKLVGEAALSTLSLTPEAVNRLGIKTVEAAYGVANKYYSAAGQIVVPPGQDLQVEAPIAGSVSLTADGLPKAGQSIEKGRKIFEITPLLPVERDLKVNAEAEVEAAVTRVDVARAKAERAARLLSDGVGSVRAREDADEAVLLAQTALNAARARLQQTERAPVSNDVKVTITAPQSGILKQVHVAENQIVSAGTILCEIVRLDPVWIRTPVYSGDVGSLAQDQKARVRSINAAIESNERLAAPVQAPPSADPLSGTTDLFYQLANRDRVLHPGERVSMSIPMKGTTECLQVPQAAILYDIHGGAWVYENIEPLVFTRRRVTVGSMSGDSVCLSEGPVPGAAVVTDGAAELFGTEFEAGK